MKAIALFNHTDSLTMKDIPLLKTGRHFRYQGVKIMVGGNEIEYGTLMRTAGANDLLFVVPDCGSPTMILQGDAREEAASMAALLTAAYSHAPDGKVNVLFGARAKEGEALSLQVLKYEKDTLLTYII